MRTKVIISFILILLFLLTFAGLAGAQIESPTYVPPPIPGDGSSPTVPVIPPVTAPVDDDKIATPQTSGGMAVGYSALLGLLLITSAVPFLRK